MQSEARAPQRFVYACMVIGLTMMVALLWMPSILGALARGYALDAAAISRLASVELAGFLSGSLFTSNKTIADLRKWVFIACGLICATNLLALGMSVTLAFMALRLIAGVGAGIGFGFGLKACAMSRTPTRNFGIFTGAMSLVMIVGFQSVAYLIESRAAGRVAVPTQIFQGVVHSVFAFYACLAAAAASVLLLNRRPADAPGRALESKPQGWPAPLALLGLSAIAFAFMGQGGVWTFLQTLGVSHGFTVSGVANAMSVFALMGVLGSLSAAVAPQRMPRTAAIAVAFLLLCGGLYALYSPRSLGWYVAGCAVGGFYWNFILPLILGLLARIDESGRASVLGGTMSSIGAALGPLLAGQLIRGEDYTPVGWMVGALCLVSLVCVGYVERHRSPHLTRAH